MSIIAHRGFWSDQDHAAQNTPGAFEAALRRGWGVELDIWAATTGDYLLA